MYNSKTDLELAKCIAESFPKGHIAVTYDSKSWIEYMSTTPENNQNLLLLLAKLIEENGLTPRDAQKRIYRRLMIHAGPGQGNPVCPLRDFILENSGSLEEAYNYVKTKPYLIDRSIPFTGNEHSNYQVKINKKEKKWQHV